MEKKPLVAIVLVNYNGYDDTVECVQSILQSDYTNYRIIIVDNASDDAPVLREDTFLNAHADIVDVVQLIGQEHLELLLLEQVKQQM